jgi:hypothetical protein
MNRVTRIRNRLNRAAARGRVTDYYAYSPGDRHGRRWVLSLPGWITRTCSTRELEAFLDGVEVDDR